MKRKRDYFYDNFQLIVFTINYILSCFFLYGLFIYFSSDFNLTIKLFFTIGYLIVAVLLWSYLFVLFSIPQKLNGAFDSVKNKISTKEISDTTLFSKELASFLIKFFNYSFFDIEYAAVYTKIGKIHFSSKEIEDMLDWKKIGENSEKSVELKKNGRLKIDHSRYSCYTTPIFFNDKYLGFFTVFTKQRLSRLSLKFLTDLEENFIDDQLIRLIPDDK
ncbi:MAG: hypothetical protein KAS71_08910 [Bacteroidales bacterium]|nr:hypothetical protein [Bacteroidales bacterium]